LPDKQFRRSGDNLTVNVHVDFATAALGGKVTVANLADSVQLTIPPGTQGGTVFRLKGRGMPRLGQKGVFGDLMAKVRITVPRELTEEERRILKQLKKGAD